MQANVREAIGLFLRSRRSDHNGPDIIDRWTPNMETQVNVAAGDGLPVPERRNTYTNGEYEWWNIRIPKNANSQPEFKDYPLRYPLDVHAEAIGCTGWDWVKKRSRWVGFDFDSITGHAAGVGISDAELANIADKAKSLPYVEVRKSTGGSGLHLYVLFDEEGIPTENHTEHAAVARCVLGMMSTDTGFDFASQIDACGGNMWVWHRKMTGTNGGLKLLKASETRLSIEDLPKNWKAHIEVVKRRHAKIKIDGISKESADPFDQLVSSRQIVPLDERHKDLMDALRETNRSCVWVPDHHLLQAHTLDLQAIIEEKREELALVGIFKTSSSGSTNINCFLFPLPNGSWKVYRFNAGVREDDTWTQDGNGWTTCYFNRIPDLDTAARAMGGTERERNGGYLFEEAGQAIAVTEMLGQAVDIPEDMLDRSAILRKNSDGRIIIDMERLADDEDMRGWTSDKKQERWIKLLNIKAEQQKESHSFAEWDRICRHLKTPNGKNAGFMLLDRSNSWIEQAKDNIRSALISLGCVSTEAEAILGSSILNPWQLCNVPFQSEYSGNRQWNLRAPQLAFKPSDIELPHPHWDLILNHIGKSLDGPLQSLLWAKQGNILTGADYLRAWIAIVIREPFKRLPYLFLHGPEESGKSILWEAISLLMTTGVVKADRVFANRSEFNGELANCVIGVLEERDIAKTPGALGRLKDYVTGLTISIRSLYTAPYDVINTTHWIQCANPDENTGESLCPIFPGDSRITSIFVSALPKGSEIPKEVLMQKLREEAPAFLRTLLDLTLPAPMSRLRLPIVETEDKRELQEANAPLLPFVAQNIIVDAGAKVVKNEVYKRYEQWAADDGQRIMDSAEFGRRLRQAIKSVRPTKVEVNGKRINAYQGIKLAV